MESAVSEVGYPSPLAAARCAPRSVGPARRARTAWLALLLGALLAMPTLARADAPYFYRGYDYGNQALFDPLYVLLNRGFDVVVLRPGDRNIFTHAYGPGARNVLDNLAHPIASISEHGWWKFTRQELLPLSFAPGTQRWVPNYSLHLLGGGSTFTMLREWAVAHDVPVPALVAGATLLGSAFINETIENKGKRGVNVDCIADVYVFDLGGMLLFSFDAVNRFFSEEVVLLNWSLQPTFILPSFDLENQADNIAARWQIPAMAPLSLFAYGGLSHLGGLSYRFDGGYALTVGVGRRATRLKSTASRDVANPVIFGNTAAAFVDRDGSLVTSFQVSDLPDRLVHVNLYPNAFWHTNPGFGAFALIDMQGRPTLGVSVAHLPGLGGGWQ